ncbi:uncharacterized protein [Panulirus ornatus]|uniref:uncharacterized protein isoform X2 n=1 Tax=Panulirus ornatus TaxID=150431 RepID=UPI003A87B32E
MDGGLLSLRWNDHGQTFFSMLSSVRKREVYCDVTLACDGRFYPVHKLVLSTCSDFFDQMFEKTACKHPVIVMANIAHKDLEALLNYMYLGEVNVLQTELSALMKAAEMLRIKGLAEPTKGLSAKDTREGKRTISWDKDLPDSKRRKSEEIPGSVSRLFQSSVSESDRTTNTRDTQKSRIANSDSQNSRLSIQIPTRCESSSSSSTDQIGTSSTEPPSQPTSQEAGASSQADPSFEPVDKPPRPEVKMEEVLVKEEPSGWFPDTEEGLESLQYSEPDTSLEYSSQQTNYQAGCLPWELAATQAQTLDTHLSQNIPGPSRIQGTEESSQARPMTEKSIVMDSAEAAIPLNASSHLSCIDIGTLNLSLPKRFSTSLIKKILTTRFVPHKYWKPPQRQFGKYRRRVPEKLFNIQEYPTLRYSVIQDGLYCAPCVVFQNTDAILIGHP